MNSLPTEIINKILLNVDLDFLVKNCLTVNKSWKNEIKSMSFMIDYCIHQIKNFPNLRHKKLSLEEYLIHLRCLSFIKKNDYISLCLHNASSTDKMLQHAVFTISNHPFAFWSSKGSDNKDSNEILTYGILFEIGIINQLKIRFLKAKWIDNFNENDGYPCFTSENVKVIVENKKNEIIYSSKIFSVEHNDSQQIFNIDPIFVTKDCRIHIHLIGKREAQLDDSKYYVCINSVSFYGITEISLPYEFDGTKFSLIEKEKLVEKIKKVITIKQQLYYISDFIVRNQNNIREENVLEKYLDDFSKGEPLELN